MPKIMNVDLSTLVLLTKLHTQANPQLVGATSDIDKLIAMAEGFENVYGGDDWEEHETPWDDTVTEWYNKTRHTNWNPIDTAGPGDGEVGIRMIYKNFPPQK